MSDLPKKPPKGNPAFEITGRIADALDRRDMLDAMSWSDASCEPFIVDGDEPTLLQAYAAVQDNDAAVRAAKDAASARAGPPAAPPVEKRAGGPTLPPRFLSRRQSAELAGVGTGTFDAMVVARTMPQPVQIPGHRRKVWDRRQIERACSALSGELLPPTALDQSNPWDEVLQ